MQMYATHAGWIMNASSLVISAATPNCAAPCGAARQCLAIFAQLGVAEGLVSCHTVQYACQLVVRYLQPVSRAYGECLRRRFLPTTAIVCRPSPNPIFVSRTRKPMLLASRLESIFRLRSEHGR
jgi:hypothetical protein